MGLDRRKLLLDCGIHVDATEKGSIVGIIIQLDERYTLIAVENDFGELQGFMSTSHVFKDGGKVYIPLDEALAKYERYRKSRMTGKERKEMYTLLHLTEVGNMVTGISREFSSIYPKLSSEYLKYVLIEVLLAVTDLEYDRIISTTPK